MRESFSEAALLEEISAGGSAARKALKPLYCRYAHRFKAYFQQRGLGLADAEDLCQECFIKIVKSAPAAQPIRAPRAWLWSLAKSVLLDFYKSRRPSAELDEAVLAEQVLEQATEGAVDLDIEHCIERQFAVFAQDNPQGAQVLRWAVIEGFTAVEIAEMIGRSHGASREYLSQLRKKLRPILAICQELLHAG